MAMYLEICYFFLAHIKSLKVLEIEVPNLTNPSYLYFQQMRRKAAKNVKDKVAPYQKIIRQYGYR